MREHLSKIGYGVVVILLGALAWASFIWIPN